MCAILRLSISQRRIIQATIQPIKSGIQKKEKIASPLLKTSRTGSSLVRDLYQVRPYAVLYLKIVRIVNSITMASKKAFCVLLVLTFSLLVEDTEAGWKFWKKDKPEETTTASTTSTTTTTTVKPVAKNPQPRGNPQVPSGNTNRGIAAAADPALAVGVGSSGTNIRNNARPQRPNPGTEVGQEFPGYKPPNPAIGNGQNYRDWALDITGAGEPGKPSPKLPSHGPALTPGGSPAAGSRPGSPSPGSPPGKPGPVPSTQTTDPASRPNSPALNPQQPVPGSPSNGPHGQQPNRQGLPASGPKPAVSPAPQQPTPVPRPAAPLPAGGNTNGQHTSTLHVGAITPAPTAQRPGSAPVSPGNASPPGGKTWAQVAGGGSRPNSPTPASTSSPGQGGTRVSPGTVSGNTGARAAAVAGGVAAANAGKTVYSSNPTFSKGNTVTNEDLEKLSESLWIKDKNNAWQHIRLNLQKQTSSSSPKDEAPEPLLTVNPQALQIPTIAKVLTLYDNYQLDTRSNEYISPAQRNEESLLIDTFLSTNVMSAAMRFLADKGLIRKDYYEYKDTLRRMWFNLYSRGEGKIGSTGFEHVFLTELKLGTEVSGLHNWIYFNAEEVKRRADYLGYIKKLDLGDKAAILKFHAKFNNIDKPVTTMFIGTSPELEMSLYTVCFFTRPEQPCPVSLGGTKFNIITHKFKYRGYDLVGSAYPDI